MTRLRRQIGAGPLAEKGCFPCVLSGISQCGVGTPRASYSGLVESSTGHCRSFWVSVVGWVQEVCFSVVSSVGDGGRRTFHILVSHWPQLASSSIPHPFKDYKVSQRFNFCSSYCKLNAKEVHGQELELCGAHFQRRQGSLLAARGSKF